MQHYHKSTLTRGFTLIEILISLVILGMMMAAVGLAFNASVTNYTSNANMFQAMSTARQAMMRMTSDLRTATAVSSTDPATQCSMTTADGRNITYQFDSASNRLNLVVNIGPSPGTYVLCRNVSALTFTRTSAPADPPDHPLAYVKNVRINMSVTVGNEVQTVASAAVIRRNM
jgi:prepilin-type N-terminal cleavage/methylation domain-containing protein